MEMSDYRKQVSQLEMELESLRGTNDYLERNLAGKKFRAQHDTTLGMTPRVDKIKINSIIISAHTLIHLHLTKRCGCITVFRVPWTYLGRTWRVG